MAKTIDPYDQIFTSYFAERSHKEDARVMGVSIAVGTPRFFKGPREPDLFPFRSTFSLARDAYVAAYNRMLDKLDPEQVCANLYELTEGKTPVLLCFEARGHFCHRRLVAEWLESKLRGVIISEYGILREDTPHSSLLPSRPTKPKL